jgi:hypothetical protein
LLIRTSFTVQGLRVEFFSSETKQDILTQQLNQEGARNFYWVEVSLMFSFHILENKRGNQNLKNAHNLSIKTIFQKLQLKLASLPSLILLTFK